MSHILNEIIAHKREEVKVRQRKQLMQSMVREIEGVKDLPRGFIQALQDRTEQQLPAVIAEVKQASPSQGIIAKAFDPVATAKTYAANGATCLSVLTDEKYFKGHDSYLKAAREVVSLPVLRKEFIIDEFQVAESRLLGADAILLIVAALDDMALRDYTLMANDLGMDVLVEVHDEAEFDRAMALPIRAIGVNNRDLRDFSVRLQTSIELAKRLPEDRFLISESGIVTHEDIVLLQTAGIYGYLIGGSLMAQDDPGEALSRLINGAQNG